MTFVIHVPRPDPYVTFFRMIGGKPQTLCHGDDLPSGTVASWNARHGALAGTAVGSPVSDDANWAGTGSATFRSLSLSASQWVHFDAEAANYNATTSFLWVVAVKHAAMSAARNLVALGSSTTANNYRGAHINNVDGSFFWSHRNGTSETDAGLSITATETAQSLWAIHLKGGTVTMIRRTNAGDTTLLNTTHTQSGTLNVDRFTLGALITSGTQSANTAIGYYRFFAAMRAPSANAADLPNILTYTQHNLRCPIP